MTVTCPCSSTTKCHVNLFVYNNNNNNNNKQPTRTSLVSVTNSNGDVCNYATRGFINRFAAGPPVMHCADTCSCYNAICVNSVVVCARVGDGSVGHGSMGRHYSMGHMGHGSVGADP